MHVDFTEMFDAKFISLPDVGFLHHKPVQRFTFMPIHQVSFVSAGHTPELEMSVRSNDQLLMISQSVVVFLGSGSISLSLNGRYSRLIRLT